MGTTKEQMTIIHSWFDQWEESKRKMFYCKLMTKVQSDEMYSVLDGLQSLIIDHGSSSVFDCQLRLFEQWFGCWTIEERELFMESVQRKDEKGIEEIYKALNK